MSLNNNINDIFEDLPNKSAEVILQFLIDQYKAPIWAIAVDCRLSESVIRAIYKGKNSWHFSRVYWRIFDFAVRIRKAHIGVSVT